MDAAESPDPERDIPPPDESGVRVVAQPLYEVRVDGKAVASFADFLDAHDESNRIGFRAGAEVVRVLDGVECLIQKADENPLVEAYRYIEEAERSGRLSKRQAEKIHRGMA